MAAGGRIRWFVATSLVRSPLPCRLLLVAGLAAVQFAAERAGRLAPIARDVGDLQLELDALVKPAVMMCDSCVKRPRTISPDASRRPPRPYALCCGACAGASTA